MVLSVFVRSSFYYTTVSVVMDENLTRGYCQLRSTESSSSRVEIVSSPPCRRRPHKMMMQTSHVMPPLDTCRCIYWALLMCGAGFLLPYNSFITAVDYYQVSDSYETLLAKTNHLQSRMNGWVGSLLHALSILSHDFSP